MTPSHEDLIQQARDARRTGDKESARKLLAQVVRQDPKNARAWYLLSQVVDKKVQVIYCLEQVLKQYPDNEKVKRKLELLKHPQGVESVRGPTDKGEEKKEVPVAGISKPKRQNIIIIAGAALVSLCAIVLVCVGSQSFFGDDVVPTTTEVPHLTDTMTTTETPIPTNTPEPTYTASPLPTDTPAVTLTPVALLPDIPAADCVPLETKREIGQVIEVVDGDTITVRTDEGDFRVRYIGMDTPERDQVCGPAATKKNRELVEWKIVVMVKDVSETDRYDRLLKYVFVEDIFVNYELVYQGYANASTYPPDVACDAKFLAAESNARNNERGCWLSTPTSPPPPPTSPPQQPTQPPRGNCDPSYPTVCIPPPPPDLDCGDISHRRFKVLPPDPHRFDGDHDGVGCESG